MAKRRRRGLGSSAAEHVTEAERADRRAVRAAESSIAAAERGDCSRAAEHLLQAYREVGIGEGHRMGADTSMNRPGRIGEANRMFFNSCRLASRG